MGDPLSPPRRAVHHADAFEWLASAELSGCSLITSLPDVSELPTRDFEAWRSFFARAAEAVLLRCPSDGVAIFYQSDIKRDGTWVDKGFWVQQAADRLGVPLLWHKVVCRKPAGTVTFARPGYSHLLCFSRGVRVDLSRATADVLPDAGAMPWTRAMGVEACAAACRWVLANTSSRTVVDPFCGVGTLLAVANALGLDAIGVELNKKRARRARSLLVELEGPAPRMSQRTANPPDEP